MGNDREVMIRALALAVQDSSVLVQRNTLDLLIAAFPVHETTLRLEIRLRNKF